MKRFSPRHAPNRTVFLSGHLSARTIRSSRGTESQHHIRARGKIGVKVHALSLPGRLQQRKRLITDRRG